MAPPMPRLNGRRTTCAPRSAAIPAVRSVEPSSITTMSKPGSRSRISSITRPTVSSSLSAGTIAMRFSSASCARTASRGGAGTSASSATRTALADWGNLPVGPGGTSRFPQAPSTGPLRGRALRAPPDPLHWSADADRRLRRRYRDAHELEDLACAMRVGVLVEDALARASPHRLRRGRVVEQLAVGGKRLVGGGDDADLRLRIEPALDPLLRIRDDRRPRRCQLERTAGRRPVHRRVRAPRDVQVDPRSRDRLGEHVERDVADQSRVPDVAPEVLPAEREVDLRIAATRLPDQRLHPFAAEFVPVPVEEDVVLLLDRSRLEQLRIDSPEDG